MRGLADADRRADGGDLRARARALRREMRGVLGFTTREWDGGGACPRVGGQRAIPTDPRPAQRPAAHRGSRAPTCPGVARASSLGLFLHDDMLKEEHRRRGSPGPAHARLLAALGVAPDSGRRLGRHSDGRGDNGRQLAYEDPGRVTCRRSSGKSKRDRPCASPPSESGTTCRVSTGTPRGSRILNNPVRPSPPS